MDIICKQDSSYVYRAVSFLKTVHSRICGDAAYARALLPIAQFFLNHSKSSALAPSSTIWSCVLSAQHFVLAVRWLLESVTQPWLYSGMGDPTPGDPGAGLSCALLKNITRFILAPGAFVGRAAGWAVLSNVLCSHRQNGSCGL